jgi:uncharacterized membrane protein YkoI
MKKFLATGIGVILALTAAIGFAAEENQAQLARETKITRSEARHLALKEVPKGTVKSGEIERENGRLIWSFDISKRGSANITEVQVNATSGRIESVQTESPRDQASEARTESKR